MEWEDINYESLTYFDRIDESGGQTYESIIEEKLSFDLFFRNPTFIEVANETYPDIIYVINSQEFQKEYKKPIEGVNCWTSDNFNNIGVWRIKYKNKT